jgi:NAD(P)-dependent dehydrogenase (short-subunit alcohol dehydrogenase family)
MWSHPPNAGRISSLPQQSRFVNWKPILGWRREAPSLVLKWCCRGGCGPFLVSQAALPALRATGDRWIVNITSIAGIRQVGSSLPGAV